MFDLDFFKSVNDTHGHLAGDEVLQQTAARIRELLNGGEILARYGGEEFAIIQGETSLEDATMTAELCRQAIDVAPFQTNVGPLDVTISVGVADTTGCSEANELIEVADACLYQAKKMGRNRVCRPPE